MPKNLNTRIKLKVDTTANWDKATNFIPYTGELILYSDNRLMKIGDGVTTVSNLSFTNANASYKTYWSGVQQDTYNVAGNLGLLDQMYEPAAIGNKLAFLEPAYVAIEYSQDSGSTWTDAGYSNDVKRSLFGDQYGVCPIYIGNPSGTTAVPTGSTADQLMTRVTITAADVTGGVFGAYGRYGTANRLLLWAVTMWHSVQLQVQYCLNSDKNTYITWRDWTNVAGWGGPNAMSLPEKTVFGTSDSMVYAIRLVFRVHSIGSSVDSSQFGNIKLCGSTSWGPAAKSPLPYTWDSSANILPRQIENVYPSLGASGKAWKNLYLRDAIYFGNSTGGMRILNGSNYYATVNCANGMLWTFSDGGNNSNRNLNPEQDATRTLGTSSKRWKELYLSGNLSDGTNSASVSTLVNKLSNIEFDLDQSDVEVPTLDSNKRITFNINPGNNTTISKSVSGSTVTYNIAAKNHTAYIAGNNTTQGAANTTSTLGLAKKSDGTTLTLTGGTYGVVYNIYAYSSAAGGTVQVTTNSSSTSNAYTVASMQVTTSSTPLSVMVYVPAGSTYYIWTKYVNYLRVLGANIALKTLSQ